MYKRQLLNGVFYTANNIAYSALTSLITKNSKERVQMGSYRFIFAFSTSLLIQAITDVYKRQVQKILDVTITWKIEAAGKIDADIAVTKDDCLLYTSRCV